MIKLINVSKYFVTPFGRHYVFRDVSIELPLDRNVGVIGPNGAGKSTFLRLLAGADHPSSGTILKTGRISPPMGLTPVLQSSLSALENVKFAGRIYGMTKPEIDQMVSYVRDLAKIGHYFEMPVNTYSAGMRQKVAFGINMSMQFDYYLFDEISAGGDREFRKMAKAMVAERLRTSRFVMTSHDTSELLELCDVGIVIKDGTLTYFDNVRDAAIFYGDDVGEADQRKSRRRRRSQKSDGSNEPASKTDAARRMPAEGEKKRLRRERRLKARDRQRGVIVITEQSDQGVDVTAFAPSDRTVAPPVAAPQKDVSPGVPAENANYEEVHAVTQLGAEINGKVRPAYKQKARRQTGSRNSKVTQSGELHANEAVRHADPMSTSRPRRSERTLKIGKTPVMAETSGNASKNSRTRGT